MLLIVALMKCKISFSVAVIFNVVAKKRPLLNAIVVVFSLLFSGAVTGIPSYLIMSKLGLLDSH